MVEVAIESLKAVLPPEEILEGTGNYLDDAEESTEEIMESQAAVEMNA